MSRRLASARRLVHSNNWQKFRKNFNPLLVQPKRSFLSFSNNWALSPISPQILQTDFESPSKKCSKSSQLSIRLSCSTWNLKRVYRWRKLVSLIFREDIIVYVEITWLQTKTSSNPGTAEAQFKVSAWAKCRQIWNWSKSAFFAKTKF